MFAINRRNERKTEFLDLIKSNFDIKRVVDLTHWEEDGLFLEGTGSMILDRDSKIVYACRSPRTCDRVLEDFCKQMGYTSVLFDAADANGNEIYHTNVMMCLGTKFAIVCLDAVKEREQLLSSLKETNKEIVEISFEQMNNFAGNMLEVHSNDGKKFIVMSSTARKSLTQEQSKKFLEYYHRILSPQLDFIEINGGGSARCMLAELF
jgi:hypothetical protein